MIFLKNIFYFRGDWCGRRGSGGGELMTPFAQPPSGLAGVGPPPSWVSGPAREGRRGVGPGGRGPSLLYPSPPSNQPSS